MFKKILVLLLAIMPIAFPYFQVDSIEASIDTFKQVNDAFPVNYGNFGSIYVVDADSSKIYVYDFSLQSKGTIPIYQRLVDDIYVENIKGNDNIYTLNTGDLRRAYPSIYVYNSDENDNQDKRPDIYGGTSLEKHGDYFYITHFSSRVAKYNDKGLAVKEQRTFNEELLPKMLDSVFVENVFYALGETGIYAFSEDLDPISKCAVDKASSISYFDGSFVVVTEYGIKLISMDCKTLAIYENEHGLAKAYIIDENRLLGFNDNKLFIFKGKFLSLISQLNDKIASLESAREKLDKASIESLESAKLLAKEKKYGQAFSTIDPIKIPSGQKQATAEKEQKFVEAQTPKEGKASEPENEGALRLDLFQIIVVLGLLAAVFIIILFGIKRFYESNDEGRRKPDEQAKYSFNAAAGTGLQKTHKIHSYGQGQRHMHEIKKEKDGNSIKPEKAEKHNKGKSAENTEKLELENIHPRKYAHKEEHKDKYNYGKK